MSSNNLGSNAALGDGSSVVDDGVQLIKTQPHPRWQECLPHGDNLLAFSADFPQVLTENPGLVAAVHMHGPKHKSQGMSIGEWMNQWVNE